MNEGSAADAHATEDRGTAIGAGGQYTAYDVGDGRVLKWPNSVEKATRITSTMPEVENPPKLARMVIHFRDESVPHVLRLAARYPELSSAVGHPRPLPESAFSENQMGAALSQHPCHNEMSDEMSRVGHAFGW